MAVRKTESRLPAGVTAHDLGQAYIDASENYALISYLTSPITQIAHVGERPGNYNPGDGKSSPIIQIARVDYVVFVLNNTEASKVDRYHWRLIKTTGEIEWEEYTENGVFSYQADKLEEPLFVIEVEILDIVSNVLNRLSLTQRVKPPATDDLGDSLKAPEGALGGNPNTSKELVNDFRDYIFEMAPPPTTDQSSADVNDIPASFLAAIAYMEILECPQQDRLEKLNKAAEALNSGQIETSAIGVCQISPQSLAMVLNRIDWTDIPDQEDKRQKINDKILNDYNNLSENDKIDIFNLLRFPKTNIKMCAKLLSELKSRNLIWRTLNQDQMLKNEPALQMLAAEYKIRANNSNDPIEYGLQIVDIMKLRFIAIPFDGPVILKGNVVDKETNNPIAAARIDLYRTMVRLMQYDEKTMIKLPQYDIKYKKYKCYSKPTTEEKDKLAEELDYGDYRVLKIEYPFVKIKSEVLLSNKGEGWFCSKWYDSKKKETVHTGLLFEKRIQKSIATTSQGGIFNIIAYGAQCYTIRSVLKGYFDGESDTVLAPDESVKIEMKPAVNNVKESDIISLVSNFKNYDYNFDFPRYPYMLYDTFPKGLLAEDDSVNPPIITKQTNCVSFAQALLVKAWENKVPNFTWSREKLLDWVVSKEAGSANRFAGIRRVISEGMGVEVIEENTPDWVPPPWTLVQRFNYSESSINWGSGHNFIIVDVHPQTKRLLILEANSPLADRGSNPKQAGPQFRALGHIDKFEQKNYSPGTDWWKEKSLDRWDDIKNPYIKMARLKVFDLNWVR